MFFGSERLVGRCAVVARYGRSVVRACSSVAGSVGVRDSDHSSFWRRALKRSTRPSAKEMVERVDLTDALGVSAQLLQKNKRPPLLEYFRSRKSEHPTKVILVRIGEFYEAVGVDAIMLVQHAGLNPMGRGVPRAGCPAVNLRRTLRDLVLDAGFSVVVCEEVPELYSYGTRTKGKERYVAQIVSPGNPNYLVGLVDHEDGVVDFERERLTVGISAAVGGFSLTEVDVGMMTYSVHTGQTIEGVIARLQSGMYAAPIYLHESLYKGSSLGSWKTTGGDVDAILRVAASFQNEAGGVEAFSSPDAVTGLLDSVSRNLRLDREGFAKTTKKHTTRPLYFSTASQLGIHRTRGVPDLVGQVAGRDAPALVRQWIRKQLLLPPPPSISAQLRNASLFLLSHLEPLPDFPTIAKHQVAQLVRSKEANEVFFRELRDACQSVYTAGSNDKTKDFIQSLTASAGVEIGFELDLDDVLSTCKTAIQLIEDTIIVEPRSDLDEVSEQFSDDKRFLFSLRKSNESFVGKVHTAKFEKEWERAEAARAAVSVAAEELAQLGEEIRKERKLGDSKKDVVGMSFDLFNNAVWLRLPSGQKLVGPLIHPKDRNGMVVGNRFSTDKLEAAQDEYRLSCSECANAVRDQLRHLSTTLGGESLPPLVGACVLATIASAMVHHVTHAGILNGWNPASERGSDVGDRSIALRQFWPYWLDGSSNRTIANSIDLDSLVILSGPNMAGKSTVLRSVCSIVLLATSGFLVPAKEASVPFVDYIMLRTFSSDSPAEGKSGFAVEMHEMRSVLEDATENSLVLVDELGKGTEMTAGAALAGSILETLDRSGCYGIFATHLHALFDMELDAPNMKEMMMCSENEGGRVRPTLKVADGRSLESLAMTVARDCGMPTSVVNRAEELLGQLRGRRKLGKAADGASNGKQAFSAATAATPDHRVPPDLQGAELVLRNVVSHSLSCEPSSLESMVIEDCKRIRPPPAALKSSCVYIVEREDGLLYCGETDDICGRLLSHLKEFQRQGLYRMRSVFIPLPESSSGKSAARFCETKVIEQLKTEGYPLLSDKDRSHRFFASGSR
ncbi:hypothetical protein NDN08_005887 [Rhodosorus marinus]|uniref:GIY-YIG domain-containing protein n=1 Tax=Rhodosorus marinus TaxID=101924 RepID=A0AAV8V2X8_9RHOD|nr:hypothetical protein NDN08_005887 [Rhodosorus marinus]